MISQLFKFFFLYTLEIKIIFLLYLRGLEIVIKCYKVRKYSSWERSIGKFIIKNIYYLEEEEHSRISLLQGQWF